MKNRVIIAASISLTLISQYATAGSIADTYAAGDTLTAAKMDAIKAAVNGNDTVNAAQTTAITTNATTNVTQTTNIGTNAADIATNAAGIATNANVTAIKSTSDSATLYTEATAKIATSITVVAPKDGYVHVSFSGMAVINHVNGLADYIRINLNTTPTAANIFNASWRYYKILSTEPTVDRWINLTTDSVFPVTAGIAYTFYLDTDSSAANGSNTIFLREKVLIAKFYANTF